MSGFGSKSSEIGRKIKNLDELKAAIGDRPREKKVVMCHGTFDIVHPGHLRHLMYAKERADILVASITCDAHIYKANLRPFVPQDLRAINLAALQFVDYVIIDPNQTPLENIKVIKPDYFAKGFEYFEEGVHPKTKEEIAVVESYGGEMLFTPGDIIYSSSHLIESAPPKLSAAKLLVLMQAERITFEDLRNALNELAGCSVHVIGDTIVDSYTYCHVSGGLTTKTPTISVQYDSETNFAGGAAVVARHFREAGAKVTFSTVMGDDDLGRWCVGELEKSGIDCRVTIDKTRPTTQKNTFISDGYHLLRVGKLDNRLISDKQVKTLSDSIASTKADAYVFSDYRHGIFNRKTIPELVNSVPTGAFKAADSQVASRWGNILEFQDFDLITPNEREARFALGDQDSVIRPLATELYKRAHCRYLMLTLGERGIMTYRANTNALQDFFTVDSFVDNVANAVGAGDALLAYATLSLVTTKSEVIAAILGSFAAASECEREGNSPVTKDDLLKKIDAIDRLVNLK